MFWSYHGTLWLRIFVFSLTLSAILEGYSRVGARKRYILPPHTSTPLIRILILEKLQPQRKRGEPQPGIYFIQFILQQIPTLAGITTLNST